MKKYAHDAKRVEELSKVEEQLDRLSVLKMKVSGMDMEDGYERLKADLAREGITLINPSIIKAILFGHSMAIKCLLAHIDDSDTETRKNIIEVGSITDIPLRAMKVYVTEKYKATNEVQKALPEPQKD